MDSNLFQCAFVLFEKSSRNGFVSLLLVIIITAGTTKTRTPDDMCTLRYGF